jgi:hypothetical protein
VLAVSPITASCATLHFCPVVVSRPGRGQTMHQTCRDNGEFRQLRSPRSHDATGMLPRAVGAHARAQLRRAARLRIIQTLAPAILSIGGTMPISPHSLAVNAAPPGRTGMPGCVLAERMPRDTQSGQKQSVCRFCNEDGTARPFRPIRRRACGGPPEARSEPAAVTPRAPRHIIASTRTLPA